MDLIVDANILFAALIKEGATKELLFNENIHLFAPEFLIEEFSEHKKEILEKTHRSEGEFYEIFKVLQQIINIIPKEYFEDCLEKASEISPDKDDVEYFALALKLNCPIWTNETRLGKQDTVKTYRTKELIEIFRL